ncbi:UNVERIFIED_CONTAM: hypothetical protein RMT77_007942 [Armadillidium vulgare]
MFWLIFLVNFLNVYGQYHGKKFECSPIIIPMCLDIPYNTTRMPNLLQHGTQEEAAITAHEFKPLVNIKCSPYVRFFICSVFAPMCTEKVPYGLTSCRSVCTAVKEGCLPVLENLNFTWPQFLVCESFPEEGLCMTPPELKHHIAGSSSKDVQKIPTFLHTPNSLTPLWGSKSDPKSILESEGVGLGGNLCPGSRIWIQTEEQDGFCVPLCEKDFLYTTKNKKVAVAWASSWAFLSLLSSGFSLLTFCLNKKRFDYPERPVICLALSYFFYSLPFFLRVMLSTEYLSCEIDPATGKSHLASSGISSSGCIITFLLQYYFGFASYLWWTILTFCWFMTACKRWVSEGLKHYASYFHGIAWGVPAVAAIIVIALKQVNGEELLGMCYVGTFKSDAQLYLVILPHAFLIFIGTIFIILGFVSLFRIRNDFKKEFLRNQCSVSSQSTSLTTLPPSSSPSNIPHSISSVRLANHVTKLERLMIRLGFFSVLSTVPAIFVVVCRIHFYLNYESWSNEAAKAATSCEPGWNTQRCGPRMSYPPVEVELLKIFMSLIIGVTSGIWVWSPKSIILWKHFFIRCLRLRQRKDIVKSDVNLRKTSSPCSNTARSSPPGYLGTQDCRSPFVSPVYIPHQSNPSSRMHLFVNHPSMREKSHKTESDFSTSFV